MKDARSTVRYLGFQALSDGSRRFDFSFSGPDAAVQIVSIEAAHDLFSGPNQLALQECAGVCYETLKCRVVDGSATVPASLKLTTADVAQHRKLPKPHGHPPQPHE